MPAVQGGRAGVSLAGRTIPSGSNPSRGQCRPCELRAQSHKTVPTSDIRSKCGLPSAVGLAEDQLQAGGGWAPGTFFLR